MPGKVEEELICLLLSGDMGEILDTARISVALRKQPPLPSSSHYPLPLPFGWGDEGKASS
jgi:hypothetical protein